MGKIKDCLWRMKESVKTLGVFVGANFKTLTMRDGNGARVGLQNLMKRLPDGLTMVEIGSYKGESAETFLSTGKVARIYCIDPWQKFYDMTDPASYTDMEEVEACFDSRFKDDVRVKKEKGVVDDFIVKYSSEAKVFKEIDFVYIDGCHTYEAVKHDITKVMSAIAPNIAIAGHDFAWKGVAQAVRDTLGEPTAVFEDTSWLKIL